MSTQITTVVGTAIFPHLQTPNKKFVPEGIYELNLRVTTAEKNDLIKQIMATVQEDIVKLGVLNKFNPTSVRKAVLPWKQATDKNMAPLADEWDFHVKQNATFGTGPNAKSFIPALYTSDNKPFPTDKLIGMGSRVRVALRPRVWYVRGELGVTLGLVGVQVLKLVQGGRTPEALGFTVAPSESPTGAPAVEDKDQPLPDDEYMRQLRSM